MIDRHDGAMVVPPTGTPDRARQRPDRPHRKDDDLPHLRTAVGRKPATARLATSWRRLTRLASSGPRVQPTSRGEEGMTTRPSARSSAAAASATAASAAVAIPAATAPAVAAIPAVGD